MSLAPAGHARTASDGQHRALLSAFHWAAAAVVGCGSLAALVQIGFLRTLIESEQAREHFPRSVFDMFLAVVVGVAVISLAVAAACVAVAPRYRRGEVTFLQWVTAIALLPGFPLGTALGVYALVWLARERDEGVAERDVQPPGAHSGAGGVTVAPTR